jgi:hypothetical protein
MNKDIDAIISKDEQEGILVLAALAKFEKEKYREIYKKKCLGPFNISFCYRSNKVFMGRFGGGWNWALGFRLGSTTLLLQLLICEIAISKRRNVTPAT